MIPLVSDTTRDGGAGTTQVVLAKSSAPGGPPDGMQLVEPVTRRWPMLLGAGFTLAMLIGLGWQLFSRGLEALSRSVPTDPLFYLCFALFYLMLPLFDYLIFRRLWQIPPAGLIALTKKRIANDVVVSYSGEAYFYSWARARARLVAAPFGAIKDVSILSAIAGNALTLLMIVVALPLARDLLTPDQFRQALWSTGLLVVVSVPFLIFSRRVFSLPRSKLWWIFGVHCVRVILSSIFLIALAWHFALPEVSVVIWLLLAAVRMLVSRLPLIPNKELLFPLVANMLIGGGEAITQLLAFCAVLTLLIHGVLVAGFGLHAIIRKEKPW